MSVACDRSDVIPYVSWCHWLGPWPVPGSPSHNMVTTHPGYWPHNLSVLFCGEATTSTTSAASYLIVSNYSYGVIRVILVLKSFGFPVMHSWFMMVNIGSLKMLVKRNWLRYKNDFVTVLQRVNPNVFQTVGVFNSQNVLPSGVLKSPV